MRRETDRAAEANVRSELTELIRGDILAQFAAGMRGRYPGQDQSARPRIALMIADRLDGRSSGILDFFAAAYDEGTAAGSLDVSGRGPRHAGLGDAEAGRNG